jgi:divinyl protochlorophyllide a 8-vinyl-reductase
MNAPPIEGGRPTSDPQGSQGVIGPNAVTRLAEALNAFEGPTACRAVFADADALAHLDHPPQAMVDDEVVARLHAALHAVCGAQRAARLSREAGRLTGDYLLAHRIPAAAQRVLRLLPRAIAARVLTASIARHAWTFAGGGRFSYAFAPDLVLSLKGAPVARRLVTACPACDYYAATFERVFAAMLGSKTRVSEIACEARGDAGCRFVVSY